MCSYIIIFKKGTFCATISVSRSGSSLGDSGSSLEVSDSHLLRLQVAALWFLVAVLTVELEVSGNSPGGRPGGSPGSSPGGSPGGSPSSSPGDSPGESLGASDVRSASELL